MSDGQAPSLISELKRRRVFRVLVGYGVVSFAVLQIVEPIMHALHLPDAVLTYTVLALALGFPVAIVLAWAFDINEGKIERTGPALKGARIPMLLMAIGVVAAAPGVIWYLVLPGHSKAHEAAAPSAAVPSIAVLPLVNLSSDKEQEYFSDGLTEELLNLLAKVPGLHVAARTSAFAFKGKNVKMSEIGQELGVATLLEGSVRKSGDQIRITTQLINASDGYHLWSETYDRKFTDIFVVQDEIAKAVVGALKLRLLPGQQPDTRGLRAENPDAYLSYLEGLKLLNSYNIDDYQRAQAAFRRALDLEPGFGPAWAGLGYARFTITLMGGPPSRAQALEEIEKGIALAPGLALAWSARSLIRAGDYDWDGERADLDRALALSPGDPQASLNLGRVQAWSAQFKEGVETLLKALERDPLNPVVVHNLGCAYLFNGDLARARQAFDRELRLASRPAGSDAWPIYLLLLEGKPQEALAASRLRAEEIWRLVGAALAEHALGHEAESLAAVNQLHDPRFTVAFSVQVAQVHAFRGERDLAFAWLDRAWDNHDVGMSRLKVDPLLRKLSGDPRYTALLKKMNLPLD